MDNSKYVEYVNSHESDLAKCVNDSFENSKDIIREKLIRDIKDSITPVPCHYDWQYDGNPYDFSGEIIKNGYVDLNQTINSFLENEYTGNTEATYVSHCGFNFNTYGDELRYLTMEIASKIMSSAIKTNIEERFNVRLSEDEFEDIGESCYEFDAIYDETLASDFFCYEAAIEFVGIGNIKLTEL